MTEIIMEKIVSKIEAQCKRLQGAVPYIPQDSRYTDRFQENPSWWTNGFWGGINWQLYYATKKEVFRKTAEDLEKRLDDTLANFVNLHHDVGFMWLHTAVANYRITDNEASLRRGLHAAGILAGRYNPAGKFINAWNGKRMNWMIIDCLMNLPLLYWAKNHNSQDYYEYIAKSHADTTLSALVREDGSTHHIGIMDTHTGEAIDFPRGQGYASGSSWSRGNSWAVYGLALSYRHTGEERYLNVAKKAAHYFITNVANTAFIPLVDFRAPKEPVMYDTTAGLIAACGLLEIAGHLGDLEKSLYESYAKKIIDATIEKHCDFDPNNDGIVDYGSVAYHDREIHVPIIYGDYFLVEAILRLLGKGFHIW